jgi:hypothetical protein
MSQPFHNSSERAERFSSDEANSSEAQRRPGAAIPLGLLYVGCAGFSYPHWRHTFYPPNVRAENELQFYQLRFNACEINFTCAFLHLLEAIFVSACMQVPPNAHCRAMR